MLSTDEAGLRIMIVEDEALVAISLSVLLTELGFGVVGPYSKVTEGMAALKDEAVHFAILDINLGGEFVYPLADILRDAHVPFVFVTGYCKENVDRRFLNVEILQKPIEREMLQHFLTRSLGDDLPHVQSDGAATPPSDAIKTSRSPDSLAHHREPLLSESFGFGLRFRR
jgi:two-component SAPR family response regulator